MKKSSEEFEDLMKELVDTLDYKEDELVVKATGKRLKTGCSKKYARYHFISRKNKGVTNNFMLHDVVYFYHHRTLPKVVAHLDRDSKNNKIENLMAGDMTLVKIISQKDRKNTSSKYRGVHYNKRNKNWIATICAHGKRIFLKTFNTEEEAAAAIQQEVSNYIKSRKGS